MEYAAIESFDNLAPSKLFFSCIEVKVPNGSIYAADMGISQEYSLRVETPKGVVTFTNFRPHEKTGWAPHFKMPDGEEGHLKFGDFQQLVRRWVDAGVPSESWAAGV